MSRFSRRHGYVPDDLEIRVREDAPLELRGVIVDIAYEAGLSMTEVHSIVMYVLRRRPDPEDVAMLVTYDKRARKQLDSCDWYEVYDVLEALAVEAKDPGRFQCEINEYLQRRGIGWYLTEGRVCARGGEAFERAMQDGSQSLSSASRSTAANEIHEALRDLSRRPKPDLTGSVQHALAALECVARDISGDQRRTLGEIIKKHAGMFPPPLHIVVDKLWGFASEQGRHLREGDGPTREDAELTVHAAAAITTYLSKVRR